MGIRILHAIASVNTVFGGPIEGLTQFSLTNQKYGHTVEVVSMDAPDDPWVATCPIKCHAMGPRWLGLKYGYTPRLYTWLVENRKNYDVVVVNGIWQYSSFAVWRALRGTPTPYFVFPHGMLDPWFKRTYPFKHLKKWLYWPWAEYRVLRDAAAVLFTCESERRLARQSFWLYKCDEFVANYGTAPPPDRGAEQREAFLAKFPHLANKRCALFLGRVHVKKGVDITLKAFAEIVRRDPAPNGRELHLIIAGPADDAYGRSMKELARKLGLEQKITWTGMVAGDLKWGAFRASDVFVLFSHQENFGIAVVEALACGVPVLISNQVNIWLEIQQGNAGFVEMDNFEGAVALFEKWLACEKDVWNHMGVSAKVLFAERFHVERTAQSFVRAMQLYVLRDPNTLTAATNEDPPSPDK